MTSPVVRKSPYCQSCGQPAWTWIHAPGHPALQGESSVHKFVPFKERTFWEKYGAGITLAAVAVAITVAALLSLYFNEYLPAQP